MLGISLLMKNGDSVNRMADIDSEHPGLTAIQPLTVGITCNTKSAAGAQADNSTESEAEFDEPATIQAIYQALTKSGCNVEVFEANAELPVQLLQKRPDIVFNIAEGRNGRGREAQVPALLNWLGIPFTGSDETTMCLTMDKALTKRLLAGYGIRTPGFQVVKSTETTPLIDRLNFPVIVKPNAEGSSIGITGGSIAWSVDQLRVILVTSFQRNPRDLLIEEYILGREFTVGLLGNPTTDLRVFTPMEIIFKDPEQLIYSLAVKQDFHRYVDYACPPDLDAGLLGELTTTAEQIYTILECRDFARIDFRLADDGLLYFIEINPLPGLAPDYSDYPMLAAYNGIDYETLIQSVLASAMSRYQQSVGQTESNHE
ncbi:MAG: ATP-grasp domain-containing protein [Coriobacteriales bacterium]|jgi:D-alanine-D-alanine ligase|nr:ATP-grasp domain-containing protein [Coriobacteriales bacterium]